MHPEILDCCCLAKSASGFLAGTSGEQRNRILSVIASSVLSGAEEILQANAKDVASCKKPASFIDRLTLTHGRIEAMAEGVKQLISLSDPLGRELASFTMSQGILAKKVSVPLGVIGIVYEARPNVTVDAIALCVKSGNAVVLRGGSDAFLTNLAIVNLIKRGIETELGFNSNFVQFLSDTTHKGVEYFCTLNKFVDVLIPRGSASLIRSVVQNSTIPVIETGEGNCHIYLEQSADINMAVDIVLNAKTQRPSVCNACESLVIDRACLGKAGAVLQALSNAGVEIRGDAEVVAMYPTALPATQQDFVTEFLGLTISCMVVDNFVQAVEVINKNSTHHSEAILSNNDEAIEYFTKHIDSAAVYVNASTRFTDGFEYGFGAEMGISTQKLHARGPMGLNELTSYKYVLVGNGQVRK